MSNIDLSQNNTMKRQVPGSKPGIFPFVGHGKNAGTLEVEPLPIPRHEAIGGIWWQLLVFNPVLYGIVVERIGFLLTGLHHTLKIAEGISARRYAGVGQA